MSARSSGLENSDMLTADIAVATRVDAVAQEDAIENIVRDAIRRVTEGTSNESIASIAVRSSSCSNGEAQRDDVDNAIQHRSERSPKQKKKSFMSGVLKLGRKR